MTMTNKDKLINRVITQFQKNRGKSSFYCFTKDVVPKIIKEVIVNFKNKNGNIPIFIAVDSYTTRQSIIYELKHNDIDKENIKLLSTDYIKLNYHYNYKLIIIVGINDFDIIKHLSNESNFTMCILTKNIMDNEFIINVRNILPNIDVAEYDKGAALDYINSPVEERRIGVELSENDKCQYDKYTDYINTSISILGNLDNIEKCKHGDIKLNISSVEFRNTIAKENGWREDLDTTIPFMKQIDEIYNPNTLYERACNFYTITKERRDLVTDNKCKLEYILKIIKDNPDKKILIISKRGCFANEITKYLNANNIKCGDYHDDIDDCIALNEYNEPIVFKSGDNKGKPKILGWQAQSTLNQQRFNANEINVLSIKNSSNVKLKIACDIVIFTSSLCNDIISVRNRFRYITFRNKLTITYKIYCIGTIEYEKLNNTINNNIINIIDNNENFIDFDEKNGCIVL